jgi:AbiTii
LRQIQAAAIDSNTEITTVLRMARVLSARLGNAEFEKWDSEPNGYEDRATIPAYRVVPVTVKANLSDGWRQWNGAPVMTSFLPENLKDWDEDCR